MVCWYVGNFGNRAGGMRWSAEFRGLRWWVMRERSAGRGNHVRDVRVLRLRVAQKTENLELSIPDHLQVRGGWLIDTSVGLMH